MGVTFWDREPMDWARDDETPPGASGEKEAEDAQVTASGDSDKSEAEKELLDRRFAEAIMGMEPPIGAIEEYRELRAEIRHYLGRRQNTRHFAYLLSLAVLGSDFVTDGVLPAPIFAVPPLLLLCLWADELRRLSAMQRLGTYLRVVIEPSIPGLQYETLALTPERRLPPASRVFANADFPILFLSLSALCAWKVYGWDRTASFWLPLVILLIAFALTGLLFNASVSRARVGEGEEERRWLLATSNVAQRDQD